jgi:hypothetical protein
MYKKDSLREERKEKRGSRKKGEKHSGTEGGQRPQGFNLLE